MSLQLAGITYVHSVKYGKGVDSQGPYYNAEYQIPNWDDADAFVNALLGLGTGQPHRYSLSPNCVCVNASVAGRGRVLLNVNGSPSYADGALIQATYRSSGAAFGGGFSNVLLDDPGNAHQIDSANPITWCTQELDFQTESMAVPSSSYLWASDDKPADINIQQDVNITTMSLTFTRRAALPMTLVRNLRGRLNSVVFLGAAIETVWFLGARTSREWATDGSVTQRVQLLFKERDVSWNKFVRPGRMPTDPTAWDFLVDGSGYPRFHTADLRPLVAMP
jgi:hypothetical protein